MVALAVVLSVVVLVLAVLVAGLLRSHADILKALHDLGAGVGEPGNPHGHSGAGPSTPATGVPLTIGPPLPGERDSTSAPAIAGVTPGGDALAVTVTGGDHLTLVAFLSSGCATCAGFWKAFRQPDQLDLPDRTRLVVVTKGPEMEIRATPEDRDRLVEALTRYGALDKTGKYSGCDRADITRYPGAGPQTMVVDDDPIPLHALLDANFWNSELYEEAWDWQATMMQPVGGMQQISNAFARALGPLIIYEAPVTEIAKTPHGVRVTYEKAGALHSVDADYAVCAMPLTILRQIKADLDADHRRVVQTAQYRSSFKIPWESKRFWETDYNIYGGLSFLSQGPSPVWYPSAALMSERGIVVSGYMDEFNDGFDKLTMQEKFDASRAQIEKLHPGHGKDLEKPVFCGWRHVKWNEGPGLAEFRSRIMTR